MTPKFGTWFPAMLLATALVATASCSSGGKGGNPTAAGGGPRELNSGDIGLGGTFQHRFTAAGTFSYHCIHHFMAGSVLVSAEAADTLATVSIVSSTASFPPASVKPNGRVIWINNDDAVHTVTSD